MRAIISENITLNTVLLNLTGKKIHRPIPRIHVAMIGVRMTEGKIQTSDSKLEIGARMSPIISEEIKNVDSSSTLIDILFGADAFKRKNN